MPVWNLSWRIILSGLMGGRGPKQQLPRSFYISAHVYSQVHKKRASIRASAHVVEKQWKFGCGRRCGCDFRCSTELRGAAKNAYRGLARMNADENHPTRAQRKLCCRRAQTFPQLSLLSLSKNCTASRRSLGTYRSRYQCYCAMADSQECAVKVTKVSVNGWPCN
jgi:hypothetical protein